MRYNNYHRHSIYSNIRSLDTVTKPIQYLEKMKELGHTNYLSTRAFIRRLQKTQEAEKENAQLALATI